MIRDPVTILMVNAADAITESVGDGAQRQGKIRISTRLDGEHGIIEVAGIDSGRHLEIRQRVFDPFFTTRRSGKAAGRGQAGCHNAILKRQAQGRVRVRVRGRISPADSAGVGATLTNSFPVSQPASAEKSVTA